MGDDRLELAKAKELASVMGGAWHSEEWDVDSDSEQSRTKTDKGNANGGGSSKDGDKTNNKGGFLSRTLYRPKPSAAGANGSAQSSGSKPPNIPPKSGAGGNAKNGGWGGVGGRRSSGGVRRPADGRAPGRRDPTAVARLEAEAAARAKAEKEELGGRVDLSWQLPSNVDYYSAPAALLRELVKEMPADKRLSFQTRVANARTKESIESVLEDYAERLESLVLPHARSREMDLQQVKKDTARERVVLDGEEIVFWGSASDKPHTWHEELWATLEARVMESVLSGGGGGATGSSEGSAAAAAAKSNGRGSTDEAVGGRGAAPAVGDKARALALEEWNKARAVATTSEVFKAMSRTGAGGDAYFALVALFCTADKLVVPVHCQESPITVEFLNRSSAAAGGKGARGRRSKERLSFGKKKGAGKGKGDDVHVLVTVPSTFDIYLRDGGTAGEGAGGGGGGSGGISHGIAHSRGNGSCGGGGSGKIHRKSSTSSNHSNGDGAAAADASNALHLVRVKAVVEEEIWGLGRAGGGMSGGDGGGSPPEDGTPPTLRFLLDPERHNRRTSAGSGGWPDAPPAAAAAGARTATGEAGGGSGGGEGELSMSRPPQAPAPLLALTRTERRMAVTVVPEPSAVSEMVRSFSRKIGVDVPSPQPPRVLGR